MVLEYKLAGILRGQKVTFFEHQLSDVNKDLNLSSFTLCQQFNSLIMLVKDDKKTTTKTTLYAYALS